MQVVPDLLDLLLVAHNYCFSFAEANVIEKLVAKEATFSMMLKGNAHTRSLVLRILEVASQVDSDWLADAPRIALLEWLSSGSSDGPFHLEVLEFSKRTDDREVLGAVYYAITLLGQPWWSTCDGLDALDKQRLTQGMTRCANKWHIMHTGWVRGDLGCHPTCERRRDVLDLSFRLQGEKDVEWWDLVGRIDATIEANKLVAHTSSCPSTCTRQTMSDELRFVRDNARYELADYFLDTGLV